MSLTQPTAQKTRWGACLALLSRQIVCASFLLSLHSHLSPVAAAEARDVALAATETTPATGTVGAGSLRAHLFHENEVDGQKFIRYTGTSGWPGGIVHWRYNDAGRPAGIVASSAAAIAAIQAAQAKWSAVCNIQFIYDGTTTSSTSLANTPQTFDGLNVIGWQAQTAPQTGLTGIGWSFPEPGPTVEGDIALNNTYNPSLDITLVHEVGHWIGLNHSDVSNVVMSGPPLTAYVAQPTLQADDIAGCVAIYGPASSPPTISGSITNGGGVAGVTFCARPSAGVTCTTSNVSGAYSCTIPSGWTGTLYSPIVSGNRIPAQVFATGVTSAVSRNVAAKTDASFACNLDVDNNGLFEPAIDGVAILRRMNGFGQSTMAGLSGTCAQNTTTSALFSAANPANFNVTGGASVLPATDGMVLLRAMQGITGNPLTQGLGLLSESGATRTSWGTGSDGQIRAWLNSTCGTDF